MTECVRLLCRPFSSSLPDPTTPSPSLDVADPFSNPQLTYSTDGVDVFPAPSAYLSRRHSWIHIFPEGKVHQHPDKTMRYFKWGVSRLLLEADPIPRMVPMWIEGTAQVMHEARQAPRFIPRPGKSIKVIFGDEVDTEKIFGDLRRKWKDLYRREEKTVDGGPLDVGVLTDNLKYGDEAVRLRIECTRRVRQQVLEVRRSTGLSDEDPKVGLVETWREEGGQQEGKMDDGSWVKDT